MTGLTNRYLVSPDVGLAFRTAFGNAKKNAVIEINFRPETRELRLFSVLLIPFGALVGYIVHHYGGGIIPACITGGILATLGLIGTIQPGAVRWLFVGWLILAFPIGWTISHLVMAVVFFGLFFPIGLVARCFGYDPLQMRASERESFWHTLEPIEKKEQYFRQF